MKDSVRTFIAVEIGEGVRQRTSELIQRLDAAGADVKWVERHNRHLTVKFLDEVPLREIPRIHDAIQRAAAGVAAFDLEIRGAGAFPHPGRPRTLWVGAGEGGKEIAALAANVEKALAKLGFRKEARRFESHLTIGRVRGGGPAIAELGRLLRENADFDAGRCHIAELVIFSSNLTPQGPIYEALGRVRLA